MPPDITPGKNDDVLWEPMDSSRESRELDPIPQLSDEVKQRIYEDFVAPGGRCTPAGKDVNEPSCSIFKILENDSATDGFQIDGMSKDAEIRLQLDSATKSQAMQELLNPKH